MKSDVVSSSSIKKLSSIKKRVIEDFKPSSSEKAQMTAHANEVMLRLKKAVPKSIEIVFVGSVARGTQIRGSSDIDIFLLFPRKTSRDELEKKGLEYAKKIVEKKKGEHFEIKYAEHPYLKIYFDDIGIKADIVPAYKIENSSERGSAVDRTQLHNRFMLSNLSSKQKDDVIALKVLLKSHNIYGANAQYSGFSGYLCELLIHTYGSLEKLIKRFSSMTIPVLIEPKSKKETTKPQGIVQKFSSEFVVIDPTDPNRNVAAATSLDSLARFVLICKVLLKKPSIGFYYGPRYSDDHSGRELNKIRQRLKLDICAFHFKVPEIAEDIIWQQMRRLSLRLEQILSKSDFKPIIFVENLSGNDAIIGFFVEHKSVKKTLVQGPMLDMAESVKRFRAAHKNSLDIFTKNGRIFSLEKAKYENADELLKLLLKDSSEFPSYLDKKKAKVYCNKIPENLAKMLYSSYVRKTNL